MKNLKIISISVAFLFILSCKEEKDPPQISHAIGLETAQLINQTFVLLAESQRVISGELGSCPFDATIHATPDSSLIIYNGIYYDGCTLPNGLFAEGDYTFLINDFDTVTGYNTQQLGGRDVFFNHLNMNGLYYVGQRGTNRWATNMINLYLRDNNGQNLQLSGIPNYFRVEGNNTPSTMDDVWTLDLSDTVKVWVPSLQTNLSLHTDSLNPLQYSSDCAYIRSGALYINEGEAVLNFGDGACDDNFWLEWSSGASVLIHF